MPLIFLAAIFSLVLCSPSAGAAQGFVINFKEHAYTIYQVNLERDKLELVSRSEDGTRIRNPGTLESIAARTGKRLKFATNSGIFDTSFSPLGLYIEAGRQIAPLNTRDGTGNFYIKPNGVFYVKGDQASVLATEKYDSKIAPDLASQSGPLLVDDGTINPIFNQYSANELVRSGVGVETPSKVLFAISNEPVTFYEFAALFKEQLKCRSALYLDGVISVMYVADLDRRQTSGNFAAMFAVFEKAGTSRLLSLRSARP
jgi:uncharacterized protein YigE (DUF2233 family)